MTVQRGQKHKKSLAGTGNAISNPNKKTKGKAKTTSANTKKNKKPEVILAEVKKALRVERSKVKHEVQARIKAEQALIEAQEALADAVNKQEALQEPHIRIRQVSFVVRLTINESDQLLRVEIEHVESNKKQKFLSLDGDNLANFMKGCLSPENPSNDIVLTEPILLNLENPKPRAGKRDASLDANLVVSDVRVKLLDDEDYTRLIFPSNKPVIIQALFHLNREGTCSLRIQELSYVIRIYASEIISGNSDLLITYRRKLAQKTFEYSSLIEVSGLPPGLYRLSTVITLNMPMRITGYYTKTFVEVI